MKKYKLKPNQLPLFVLLLLLFVAGMACNAITGTADEQPEEVALPVVGSEETAEQADIPTPFPPLAEAVQEFEDISAAHEENPVYPDNGAPPPGGPHHPAWQNCGVYLEPVEARHVLHSLEHGAVWLTYNPDLSEEDVTLLQELAKDQAYTVMSPYPGLRSAVVLTGWGIQFETESASDPRITEFLLTYQQGPQTPEPGAPCQGGVGRPRSPDLLGEGVNS